MMSASASTENNRGGHELLQLLLNTPQLAQYYHFDQRPERVPFKIVNGTAVDLGAGALTVAGKPAVLSVGQDDKAFEITRLEIEGPTAEVRFQYPVEGLVGHATFKRINDRWSLDTVDVAERK